MNTRQLPSSNNLLDWICLWKDKHCITTFILCFQNNRCLSVYIKQSHLRRFTSCEENVDKFHWRFAKFPKYYYRGSLAFEFWFEQGPSQGGQGDAVAPPPIVFKTVLVKSLNPVRYWEGGQAAVHSCVIISIIICVCVSCCCKNQIIF